jgi:hypothetical protein
VPLDTRPYSLILFDADGNRLQAWQLTVKDIPLQLEALFKLGREASTAIQNHRVNMTPDKE